MLKLSSTGDLIWEKFLNASFANHILATIDGGYFVVGYREEIASTLAYAARLNSVGDTLWTQSLGVGIARQGLESEDGKFTIAMHGNGISLIQLSPAGSLLWSKGYGFAGNETYSLIESGDGGYFLAGSSRVGSAPSNGVLIRASSDGDSLWTRTFGGAGWDKFRSLQRRSDNNLIITGTLDSYKMWIVSVTPTGETISSTATESAHSGYAIREVNPNVYVIAGTVQDYDYGTYNACLYSIGSQGDSMGLTTFGVIPKHDQASSIGLLPGGNIIVTGYVDCQPVHTGCVDRQFWVAAFATDATSAVATGSNASGFRVAVARQYQQLQVQLWLSPFSPADVVVHDVTGRAIIRGEVIANGAGLGSLALDTSTLAQGVYFLIARFRGEVIGERFLVSR